MPGSSTRVAVIDIGTNSTRLFVADVADGRVDRLERQSRVTRLGRGVDLSGQLSSEAIEETCAVIAEYVKACDSAGVEEPDAIATSAVRDAENGDAFVAELRERFALSARILNGEEEARLTYVGATSERPSIEPVLVIDIGGGSTELIVGHGDRIDFHTSLQAGVVRHTERHIATDPPTTLELEALAGDARTLIEAAVAGRPMRGPPRGSRSPAPQPRSRRSSSGSTPTTPSGYTARFSRCRRSSACSRCSPRHRSLSGPGSSACTRTGHRRSSPAS